MAFMSSLTTQLRTTIHFLKPVKEICLGFLVTGYVIYKLPISAEQKAKSKFLHPELADEEHH